MINLRLRPQQKMITYIIVCRNPGSGKLVVISKDDDPIEYESEETAYSDAQDIECCRAWGAEIVPCGSL